MDEGDEEQQVKGSYDVEAQLRGDLAEAEAPGDQDHDQGGEAYGGVDADDEAKGEAPRETTRGHTASEEAEEWAQDLAPEDFAEGVSDVHT